MDEDSVVLVNEKNEVLGTAAKLRTHNAHTPLHRGFSVFLFNYSGEVLLQQRSFQKKTWPGIWSNSCCGHPMLNEANVDAAKRRLLFELGLKIENIFEILPDYRYKTEMNGIFENELCPVYVAFSDKTPILNKKEVAAIKWVFWCDFLEKAKEKNNNYSFWAEEEATFLDKNKKFQELFKKYSNTQGH